MRVPNVKYISTTDEILTFLKDWSNNTNRSPNQLKHWPEEKIVEYLGCDHPNTLRLLKSDGFDDEPILRFLKTEEIFECITNRKALDLTIDDVFRVSLFFQLNDIQTLIMLLKLRWELFVANQDNLSVDEMLLSYLNDEKEQTLLENVFDIIDDRYNFSAVTGYQKDQYINLVHHILVTRTFQFSVFSKEVGAFIDGQKELMELFKQENEEYNELFHSRNKQWIRLIQTAELSHLKLEEQRMQDAFLEKQWVATFGNIYYKLLQVDYEFSNIKQQIEIKRGNPKMTIEQVVEANKVQIEENLQNLQKFETELAISLLFNSVMTQNGSSQVSDEFIAKYKKALRSIWLKTHPDRLTDKHFTPEQLQSLQNYYQEVTEISNTDRLLNPLTLTRLENILDEIDQIYQNIGLNISLNLNIKGVSLKEKSEWLEKQITLLEKEIIELKNHLYALANDSSVRQKVESLKSPDIIEKTKIQMLEKYEILQKESNLLKLELEKLFKK